MCFLVLLVIPKSVIRMLAVLKTYSNQYADFFLDTQLIEKKAFEFFLHLMHLVSYQDNILAFEILDSSAMN